MERSGSLFAVNGGIRLPIGYRFRPTEEELLVHYLKRKAFGFPLPALVIPEFDVFAADPWSLPGDLKEKNRYFFSKRSTGINGSGSGYWKPIGKEKEIVASSGTNQIIGGRKSLAFFESKKKRKTASHDHHHAAKTRWIMHEYRLSSPPTTQLSEMKYEDDWSVYCVFESKRKPRSHGSKLPCRSSFCKKKQEEEEAYMELVSSSRNSICIDFTVLQDSSDHFGPPPPSSPSSINGVTEDCFPEALDQEENSCTTAHQYFNFCTSN